MLSNLLWGAGTCNRVPGFPADPDGYERSDCLHYSDQYRHFTVGFAGAFLLAKNSKE